ncbi:MAG: hypothetical protein AAB275_09275 [Deltaproteobacteria bacterium]
MHKFRLHKWLLIFLALPIAVAMTGCKGKEVIGTPAVDFILEGINGGQIKYSELKGRPVLLYFFASW